MMGFVMFSILRKKTSQGSDLLTSKLFDESTFYKAFVNDLRSANKSVIIESPFLTERRALQFAILFNKLTKQGVSIQINTRQPRHHGKLLEIQAWKAIKILKQNGVKIYSYNDMRHRKLAIIDNQILWDGSLNILSQSQSREIMRRSNSAVLCKQMVSFTGLWNRYW